MPDPEDGRAATHHKGLPGKVITTELAKHTHLMSEMSKLQYKNVEPQADQTTAKGKRRCVRFEPGRAIQHAVALATRAAKVAATVIRSAPLVQRYPMPCSTSAEWRGTSDPSRDTL